MKVVEHDVADCGRYVFGKFELDTGRGTLRCEGTEIPLRPKCFRVLQYLIEHRGKLVSRRELMAAIWPGVLVTDSSLPQCIRGVRRALGEDGKSLIRSVPRRGYLFESPVTVQRDHPTERAAPPPRRGRRGRPAGWSPAAIGVSAVALTCAWWIGGVESPSPGKPPAATYAPPANSIAVMAFKDLSPQASEGYFADGIAEEVLHLLAQNQELTVIARTSSFAFRDSAADVQTIARKLNVSKVLEGSVRRDGDTVRVTAQLVDASTATPVWSRSFERELDDVFAAQIGIARDVASILQQGVQNRVPEAVPRSTNAKAYEHFLRARYFHWRRAPGDLDRAVEAFELAIAADPQFADAWVGLAGATWVRWYESGAPFGEVSEVVKGALDRAVQLAPDHADAHARTAGYYWTLGNDELAQNHFDRAMKAGHSSVLVQSLAAGIAYKRFNYAEAISLQRHAVALDPLTYVNQRNLALYLYSAGQLEDSRKHFQIALDLNPANEHEVLPDLLLVNVLEGRFDEAKAIAARLPDSPARDQGWAFLYEASEAAALRDRMTLRLEAQSGIEPAVRLAEFHARAGNVEQSFRWVHEAGDRLLADESFRMNQWCQFPLRHSPFMRALVNDPRWQAWESRLEHELQHRAARKAS